MEKIVLCDFCGTIADFQTLDPFLEYVINQSYPIKYKAIVNPMVIGLCHMITKVIKRFGYSIFPYKILLTSMIKGISLDQLTKFGKEYYDLKIKTNLIPATLGLIKELQANGYRIIIVSGGSDMYIRYFANEFKISDIISSQFNFENGICTGKLNQDCFGIDKVKLINSFIEKNNINCVYQIGISDSISDLPMLQLCNKIIIISHFKHQNWITKDMEEIIWE